MKLSIADLRAVLKERTQNMVGRKASEDTNDIIAGVKDIRTVIDEMELYANELKDAREELSSSEEEVV